MSPIRQSPSNAARPTSTDGLGSFLVHYGVGSIFNPNQVVLSDFVFTGDYNHDGIINAADFVLWRDTDGAPAGYAAWQSHFGLEAGAGMGDSLQSSVPEPSAWVLILGAAVAMGFYSRRRVGVW